MLVNKGLLFIALAVAGCSVDEPEILPPSRGEYADALAAAGLEATRLGQGWKKAAVDALTNPVEIDLPHRESGAFFAHETRAMGFAFHAVGGQGLRISLTLGPASNGLLYAELLFMSESDHPRDYELVAVLGAGETFERRLERAGRYLVRLQPELLATVVYHLRVELDAALPFPVSGLDATAVGSFFGDPRDAGRRRHEGIDIFAPRSTPLIAVADGIATARRNRLGGNTIWLRSDDARYYYAHLEKTAFEGRRRVAAGEILGYVGNSGNARATPPHLHFGVYRRPRGAVDPLPYLSSGTYATAPAPDEFSASHIETTASILNLRATPVIKSTNVVRSLPGGTVGRVLARSGAWLRIRTLDGLEGWIHGDYQRKLRPREPFSPPEPVLVYASPSAAQDAIDRVEAGATLAVFAKHAGALLVGVEATDPLGWLLPPR